MTTVLESDALAVLIVRLGAEVPSSGELRWHRWHEVYGASEHGLQSGSRPQDSSPHKQLPTPDRSSYFTPHVQRLLFPLPRPSSTVVTNSERWLCCPTDLSLDIGWNRDNPRRARIDLLERLSIPLAPSYSVGLIHLSLQADAERNEASTLQWGSDLRKTFTQSGRPHFTLTRESREQALDGRRPLRALVIELFGDPHVEMERNLYTIFFAKEPVELPAGGVDRETYVAGWRRALARGSRHTEEGIQAEQRDPQKAAAQHANIGAIDAVSSRSWRRVHGT